MNFNLPWPCLRACFFIVLFAALLSPGYISAQSDWESQRKELLIELSLLLNENPNDPKADSILNYLDRTAQAKKDSAVMIKVLIAHINSQINNAQVVDSLCDLFFPLLPAGSDPDRIEYYLDRSTARGLRGDYQKQVMYLDSAATIAAVIGDSVLMNFTQTELSLAYQDVENYEAALESAKKAMSYLSETEYPFQHAYDLRNVGACFHRMQKLDSAWVYYDGARLIYDENHNPQEAMYTYALMGKIESERGNSAQAQAMLQEACDLLLSDPEDNYAIESFNACWVWLAEACLANGQIEKARLAAQAGYDLADSLDQAINRIEAMKLLIQTYLAPDPRARDLFNDYLSSREELYHQENRDAILEFERKYKAKEAEQKVLLLESEAQQAEIRMQNIRFWALVISALLLVGLLAFSLWGLRNRIRTRQKIDQLNLKALQLQINPHFFFNVLNSISNFIGRNDQKSAHFFLAKFARLMRQTLEFSRENWIELSREIDFLQTYLELEQLRSDSFDFSIECPPNLEKVSIPPMLLQPFAENCVAHAFGPSLPQRGNIRIQAESMGSILRFTIEDNGIGFPESAPTSPSQEKSSLALKILEERISIYGKKAGSIRVEPAFPENKEAPGTRLILEIPLN